MSHIPAFAIGALLVAAPLSLDSCPPPPAEEPSCELIDLVIDMSGETPVMLVTNNNPSQIEFHIDLTGNWCGTTDCPFNVKIDKSLEAGETGVFIPPPGPYCDDVACCESGWTGTLNAEFTLKGSGCVITASATRTACDGSNQ